MKIMLKVSAFLILLVSGLFTLAQDSTTTSTFLQTSLSASYTANNNWQGQDFKNLSFAGSINYRYGRSTLNWRQQHFLMANLSYLKFIDSLWLKNTDVINIQLLWNEEQAKIQHSYSVLFQSQFLPAYNHSYNHELRKNIKSKSSYSFNPASLDLAYGAIFSFWDFSNINFAIANLRFSSSPRFSTSQQIEPPHFANTNHAFLNLSYGFSISTNIRKKIGDRVEWWNNSRIFCNAADRDHLNFDFNNRINVKLWKCLQLRFDTRLAYNPLVNYKIQFGQEVLLGVFFEKAKG